MSSFQEHNSDEDEPMEIDSTVDGNNPATGPMWNKTTIHSDSFKRFLNKHEDKSKQGRPSATARLVDDEGVPYQSMTYTLARDLYNTDFAKRLLQVGELNIQTIGCIKQDDKVGYKFHPLQGECEGIAVLLRPADQFSSEPYIYARMFAYVSLTVDHLNDQSLKEFLSYLRVLVFLIEKLSLKEAQRLDNILYKINYCT